MSRRSGCGALFLRLGLAAVLLVVVAAGLLYFFLATPYKAFPDEVVLEFPKGTSARGMANELTKAGVIRAPWQFLLARAVRPSARLQAGEYQFKSEASVWTVFDRIHRGDVFYYEFTVPEGSNIFEVAQIVNQLRFIKGDDFLKIARSPKLIHDLAPEAPSLEGYLFPSTYRLTRSVTAERLARIMTDLFRKKWHEVAPSGPSVPVNALVTMASMIEKETAVPAERPIVASVYQNRLRVGMALDCDPTTIYAAMLDNRYRGTIYKSDLASTNPYNTYQHPGLPPGPIASPGLSALKAALAPANSSYVYFVAKPDGKGGHNFSSNIDEHNRAVALYRAAHK